MMKLWMLFWCFLFQVLRKWLWASNPARYFLSHSLGQNLVFNLSWVRFRAFTSWMICCVWSNRLLTNNSSLKMAFRTKLDHPWPLFKLQVSYERWSGLAWKTKSTQNLHKINTLAEHWRWSIPPLFLVTIFNRCDKKLAPWSSWWFEKHSDWNSDWNTVT